MPFTAPLLSVVGLGFDCLCEYTHGIPHPTSSSSNVYRWSNNGPGTWNVISDPKSIVQRVTDNVSGDGIALTTSGTLTLTVINHPTYNSSNSSDQAGFGMSQLDSTSPTSPPEYGPPGFPPSVATSLDGVSIQTIQDVSLSNTGPRPALYFGMKRALTGDIFNITGRLLIGINKV